MKQLVKAFVMSTLLLWPALAYADDQVVKYTLLLIGGIGGVLVGAGLYALLMILAAAFLRHKVLLAGVFVVCAAIFVFSEYTSIQTLRVGLGLWQRQQAAPAAPEFTLWWQLAVAVLVVFALAIFRFSLRLWQKRQRQRQMLLQEHERTRKPR